MLDNNNPIEIDIISSEISAFENGRVNSRIVLGYIGGEFSKLETTHNLYVSVYYQRNIEMNWESVTFQLRSGEKYFYQKLPAGLTVISFYVRLHGMISDEFELVNLKILIDEIPIGKAGGESLLLLDIEGNLENPGVIPDYVKFEIKIPQIGDVFANSATVVFATTHAATSRVIFGKTPETMTREVISNEENIYHLLKLMSLELETTYFCQIYATSAQTGEEIHTGILSFMTGKEISIISKLPRPIVYSEILTRRVLNVDNVLDNKEILFTILPDAYDDVSTETVLTTHTRVNLHAENIINNSFEYSITP